MMPAYAAMRVFLLHGMGRTPASMWLLAWRLRQAGHTPSLFAYAVSLTPLPEIVGKLKAHIAGKLEADRAAGSWRARGGSRRAPYAVIGHSLGNLLTRLASPELPAGFCRFVQLAPPNQSPAERPHVARPDAVPGDHPATPASELVDEELLRHGAGARGADPDRGRATPGRGSPSCRPSAASRTTASSASKKQSCRESLTWCCRRSTLSS